MDYSNIDKKYKVKFNSSVNIIDAVLKEGSFTESGEYDAKDIGADGYKKVIVNIHHPLQNKTVTENGPVEADAGFYGLKKVDVNIQPKLQEKTVTENGPVTHDAGYDGLKKVNVDVPWEWKFWIGAMFDGDIYGGVNAGSITLPDGLTQIPANAYAFRTDLKHISIPEGVTLIKEGAFQGCKNLATISLPSTLEEIEGDAFVNCSALTINYLPDGLKKIGGSAFAYCKNLNLKVLPMKLESIGSYAFYDGKAEFGRGWTIPAGVKSIGNYAFSNCWKLTDVIDMQYSGISFKSKPESISPNAFVGCVPSYFYVPWAQDEVANAPWGANGTTILYNWNTY